MTESDSELLEEYAKHRSERAFTGLVQRHLPLVHSAALRQVGGDAHLAQDVAQEVFLILARKAHTLMSHPVLPGWLYKTTCYAAAKIRVSNQRRRARELAAAFADENAAPADAVNWSRVWPVVDDAMLDLRESDRVAVLLRFFENQPYAEIGSRLKVSENTARMRVERALDALHAALAKRKVSSTAAAIAAGLASQAIGATPPSLAAAIVTKTFGSGVVGQPALSWRGLGNGASLANSGTLTTGVFTLAALVGVFSAGYGVHALRQAGIAEKERSSVRSEVADLGEKSRRPAVSPGNAAASPPSVKSPQERRTAKFLAAYPQAREMLADVAKAQIASLYNPFFRSVRMTREEIDRFEDLMAKTMIQNLVISPLGITPAVMLPTDDQLRALLGPERFQQFQDFIKVLPAFGLVNQAALATGLAGEPLTAAEQDKLVQIVVKNGPAFDFESENAVNWDAVAEQSQAVVTPTQWQVVHASILRLQLSLDLMRAIKGQGGAMGASLAK